MRREPVSIWPLTMVVLYWALLWSIEGLRGDHFLMGVPFLVLYYGGQWLAPLFRFVLPFIVTGVMYDSLRFVAPYIRGEIDVVGPYLVEQRLFGVPTTLGILLPHELLQRNTHPIVDFVTGIAYFIYVPQFMLVAFFFCFFDRSPRAQMCWLPWGFFWINFLGYVTHQAYPTAPPWYVDQFGFGGADPGAAPSAAGCLRFDALIGYPFFAGMYAKSANVFGAVPSLHVAYPCLAALYAAQAGRLRASTSAFAVLMAFAAVYLNHHYVIDVLLGALYALIVGAALEFSSRRAARRTTP